MAEARSSYDLAVLARLVGDDRAALVDAVELFLELAPAWRDDLGAARARGDLAALDRLAHRMKSSAAALGAHRLAQACGELEHAAASGDAPAVATQVDAAHDALSALVVELAADPVLDHSTSPGRASGRENR